MRIIYEDLKWFRGVVESRMDPTKLGKVQVRVVGTHSHQKIQGSITGTTTEELPWFPILKSATDASNSGIGGAMTGIVEGSQVIGLWLDRWRTSGIIIGSFDHIATKLPVTTEGFFDPNGIYPKELGTSVNPLNLGEVKGKEHIQNIIQEANIDVAVNPDDRPQSDIPEDDNPSMTIVEMLKRDEGIRLSVYWDTEGYPTIGIGHLILSQKTKDINVINIALSAQVGRPVNRTITMEEAEKLFASDLAKMQAEIRVNSKVGPVYASVNRSRQMALENMAFQMGVVGLSNFTNMLNAMAAQDWKRAYDEGRDSLWYQQTKGRASRVTLIILNGNLESYGVAPVRLFKSAMLMRAAATTSDSRIMFKEPEPAYAAIYPFNHAYVSESGHIQEFDDTAGQERYRLMHPSGTYTEINSSGRKVVKTVDDLFDIVNGDSNNLVWGEKKTNIGADETYYNMANLKSQVDGTRKVFIRGNDELVIEGEWLVTVKGNSTVNVQGNAIVNVDGDSQTQVKGNHTYTVFGNMTWDIKGDVKWDVSGKWEETMDSMSSVASNRYYIDGSRIDLG
ncbi:baseplate hub subunit / Phage tail lysozyme [Shewanella phage Thanatos-2]|nr:baseplate hub subunit / Phage tail lysozyme [Shewanella phage Thanatos-2]